MVCNLAKRMEYPFAFDLSHDFIRSDDIASLSDLFNGIGRHLL